MIQTASASSTIRQFCHTSVLPRSTVWHYSARAHSHAHSPELRCGHQRQAWIIVRVCLYEEKCWDLLKCVQLIALTLFFIKKVYIGKLKLKLRERESSLVGIKVDSKSNLQQKVCNELSIYHRANVLVNNCQTLLRHPERSRATQVFNWSSLSLSQHLLN